MDTSGDGLLSRREIANYVASWEPASRDRRVMRIAAGIFSTTGTCLMLMMLGVIALFGNDFLWAFIDEGTRTGIAIASVFGMACGSIGFMRLMYDATACEFEAHQNARHALIHSVQDEGDWATDGRQVLDEAAAHSGIGITSMFTAHLGVSASDWVKQVLGSDHLIAREQLLEWCTQIDQGPTLRHIKYFVAMLQRNVPMVAKLTGMPVGVIYRLQEALNTENESPWKSRPLDVQTLQALLSRNHIFIPTHPMELLFKEIDGDGTGKITKSEFTTWMDHYRPVTAAAQRALVLHEMFTSIGFYALVCPFVGLVVVTIALWNPTPALSVVVGREVFRTLAFIGALENMRQAWRAEALKCDAYEQAKLELKASVETAADDLERDRAAAEAAAKRAARAADTENDVAVAAMAGACGAETYL
jgi:hypothetical protein